MVAGEPVTDPSAITQHRDLPSSTVERRAAGPRFNIALASIDRLSESGLGALTAPRQAAWRLPRADEAAQRRLLRRRRKAPVRSRALGC